MECKIIIPLRFGHAKPMFHMKYITTQTLPLKQLPSSTLKGDYEIES